MRVSLSVSLPDEDVEFIDRYRAAHGEPSRSAVVRKALALLREDELREASRPDGRAKGR